VFLLVWALLTLPGITSAIAIDDDDEAELVKHAENLFKEQLYVEAFPIFSQLLSVYPEDINYNFKFSVCVLFADENKASAISLLEKVTANAEADKRAYYYLGYAYHLNYKFRKAITAYNNFKNSASKKDLAKLPIDRRVAMCENGLTLLRNKVELGVISKTEIKETEYFRTYDMKLLTGKILVKPNDFKTSNDMDKNEESLVYLGKNAKTLFFSSYGKSGDNRDLYVVAKKPDGAWGTAERLPDHINSPYDENFPVMHPNSKFLYFSSNGHNSMGGYDVFKARYDSTTNRWSKPVNLDFAINSTDDDILYLPTADERTAYFSSKRSSIQGKISVYQVMLNEPPGRFTEEGAPELTVVEEIAEPLSIEEILKEAKLDVNATPEDFSEVESSSPVASQPPETMQAETFTELSDEEMVEIGFEYAEKIKKDELRLKSEAEAAFETARNKKDRSTAKANEAQAIGSRLDNIADAGQKETAKQKAEILGMESKKLAKQAVQAFEIAKSLTEEAEEREKQSSTAYTTAEKIKTATTSSPKGDAIPLLIEQKVLAQSIETDPQGVTQRAEEKEEQAKLKESQASEAYEKIQFMENEITEIDTDIKSLMEQADKTKEAVIKEEILSQAQELEAEKRDTEDDLKNTYVEASTLDEEATSLRQEADFQEELSNEILSASKDVANALPVKQDTEIDVTASNETDYSTQTTPETATNQPDNEQPLVSIVSQSEPDVSTTEPDTSPTETDASPQEENADVATSVDPTTPVNNEARPVENATDASTATTNPEEAFEINEETVAAAVINEQTIAEESLAVEKLESEADSYDEEARAIREKAASADPAFRENALQEAEKFETAAAQKRTQASEGKSLINSYTFRTNVSQYEDLGTNSKYLTPEDLEEVEDEQEESVASFEKAQELREAAETIDDPKDKALALQEADKLEVKSIAMQTKVNNRLTYLENKGTITQKTKSTVAMEPEEVAAFNEFNTASDNLYIEAKAMRENAATTDDPKEKAVAYRTADALEQQALEKQQSAINLHELYKYEDVLFDAVKITQPMSAQDQERLDALSTDYDRLSEEKKAIRESAETLEDPVEVVAALRRANDLESQALDKQREALNMYFEADDEVAALLSEEPSGDRSPDPDSTDDEVPTETSEPLVSIEPEASATDTGPIDSETKITTSNDPARNTEASTSSQPTAPTDRAPAPPATSSDQRTAEELTTDSEANRQEAERLYESIETIDDPEEMMAALDKATLLETTADAEMARARQLDNGSATVLGPASADNDKVTTIEAQTDPSANQSEDPAAADETGATIDDIPVEDVSTAITLTGSGNEDDESTTALRTEPTRVETDTNDDKATSTLSDTPNSEYVEPSDNSSNTTTYDETTPTKTAEAIEERSSTEETFSLGTVPASETTSRSGSESSSEPELLLGIDKPLQADIFTVEEMVPYTPSNPIPVNPAIPSGLLFKVQVGAFRNIIPQDLFKGINPIMGEKTSMGFIRYSAGLFSQLASANEAKGIIRGMGYNDAFVVAFYNGNRVSMADARKMLEDGTVPQPIGGTGSTFTAAAETSPAPVPGTTDIGSIDELFYTVQVGVYSRPSNLAEKFNLDELYTLRTSNGYIRYNHGKFTRFSEASNRKELVIEQGIGDAFVTVYLNGKRISVEQARSIPEASISMDNDDRLGEDEQTDFSVDLPAGDARYMVKIGEFDKDVPVNEATAFLAIKDLGIKVRNVEDKAIYTVGEFTGYEDAEELRITVESKGIDNASVVVFQDDRIISVEEYLKNTLDSESE